jgi:heat shock protein HtpX
MSGIIGMSGSLISLALSKFMAKRSMGVVIIESPSSATERWLLETVQSQANKAGIGMPEVGIFNSAQPNAFATGMSKNSALVAVSSGLLSSMQQNEVEAVLAHEISHISNGDMITLSLVQGVVNTFVFFLSSVIGHVVDRVIFKTERGHGPAYYVTQIIAQIFLSILATMITMWFSRWREFHADAGAASLSSRDSMIAALRALQRVHEPKDLPGEFAAFGIGGGKGSGIKKLFLSHPPLEERISALQKHQLNS